MDRDGVAYLCWDRDAGGLDEFDDAAGKASMRKMECRTGRHRVEHLEANGGHLDVRK
jgi:hypothetical protein